MVELGHALALLILQLVLTVISSDLETDKPVHQLPPPQGQQQRTASRLPGFGSWFCH